MAEELRELRLSKQIPAKDMVAVVQAIYPKYDKTVQSKCENGDAYGVSLRPDAMAALYAHFAPELAEGRKAVKKDAHRLTWSYLGKARNRRLRGVATADRG